MAKPEGVLYHRCPFCQGEYGSGFALLGSKRGVRTFVVVHTFPVCARYVMLEPRAFLQHVRAAADAGRPS